ncbi:hypothetical protein LIER_02117 [Lithospermum erythrorhizon]|uniref:C2 domain-containing protein n=1 Tax=Lithospermum erythrorhizon TaxID=34254 RepID=A0AAV3NPF3_LITER
MAQRALEVTVLSAKDINKVNLIGKMDVYIIISITGSKSKQKVITPVDKDAGTNPTWNFQAEFVIDESAAQQSHHSIVFKVKCERALGDKDIGEVHVPIRELLQSPEAIDGKRQFVSYQVRKPDGKPKGFINFAYQFGDKVKKAEEQPTMAYPPPHGSSSAYSPSAPAYPPPAPVITTGGFYAPPPPPHAEGHPPPAQYHNVPPPQGGYPHPPPPQYAGYGYPQQPAYGGYPHPPPPGYGYPPPQPGYGYAPPGQKPPKKNNKAGLGMGAGLLGGALGGLLIGDMLTDGGFVDVDFDF